MHLVVDTTRYKSIAIKSPYYDALVRMGLSMHRGPGQEMMHIIKKAADEKGIRIRDKGIIKSKIRILMLIINILYGFLVVDSLIHKIYNNAIIKIA